MERNNNNNNNNWKKKKNTFGELFELNCHKKLQSPKVVDTNHLFQSNSRIFLILMSCTNPSRYVDHLFQNIKEQINSPKKREEIKRVLKQILF